MDKIVYNIIVNKRYNTITKEDPFFLINSSIIKV